MRGAVTRLGADDLGDVLRLFDAVQAWLIERGFKDQWGELPFSEGELQRERFGAWLASGRMAGVRLDGFVTGTLVFDLSPPDYAKEAVLGRAAGAYLEAFAVHRDFPGQGIGTALLGWAAREALNQNLTTLYLDCWAGNPVLRAYYHRAGFFETAPLALGAWRGVLFQKTLRAALSSPATPRAKT